MNIHFMRRHPSRSATIIMILLWLVSSLLMALGYSHSFMIWIFTFLISLCFWWLLFRTILNSYNNEWENKSKNINIDPLALSGVTCLPYLSLAIAISPTFYHYICSQQTMRLGSWCMWFLYSVIIIILMIGSGNLEDEKLSSQEKHYDLDCLIRKDLRD